MIFNQMGLVFQRPGIRLGEIFRHGSAQRSAGKSFILKDHVAQAGYVLQCLLHLGGVHILGIDPRLRQQAAHKVVLDAPVKDHVARGAGLVQGRT